VLCSSEEEKTKGNLQQSGAGNMTWGFKRFGTGMLILGAAVAALAVGQPASIEIDYPSDGSIFPPDIAAPTFIWRDAAPAAASWRIEVSFVDGAGPLKVIPQAERMRVGAIDPRCVAETNVLPKLTPQQAAARTWIPDDATWATIKRRSLAGPATVTITGYGNGSSDQPLSRGRVAIHTSKDPVGAPIFYRDVPLIPSELQKGVIKPLAPSKLPLIAWRLRNVSEKHSRVLLEGMHTCANCHSFSLDGKTLGIDLDGPQNDKGLYAIVPVKPQTVIRNEDVVAWGSFRGKLGDQLRVGFMSQVSPDARFVVTTIKPAGADPDPSVSRTVFRARYRKQSLFYVANFKDYRFLQVFYPTRGILVWYSRSTGLLQPLPGADDPRYVHANAVWSPDGKYLVFTRAEAKDPYEPGVKLAQSANDLNETAIRYDLCRIPFNEGRGGRPEPIAGASNNGMSNSFPKVSPDGRWIVFVQARNGLLMRPDGQLYIVPAQGGQARRMRCNTRLMNSWHSFSPNGRWLVFSSKSRSPYTQMFLTHLDEEGQDSPPILIENATAANRAVNIPEFVNAPPDGLLKIEAPATEFYRLYDVAAQLAEKGRHAAAIPEWHKALALNPNDSRALNGLGISLTKTGRVAEAIRQLDKALVADPESVETHNSYGIALAGSGKLDDAIRHFESALSIDPDSAETHNSYGAALAAAGRIDEAIPHYQSSLESNPDNPDAHANLGAALAQKGRVDDAIAEFEKALKLNPTHFDARSNLATALAQKGDLQAAVRHFEKALAIKPGSVQLHNSLGFALLLQQKADLAIPHFNRAIALAPNFVNARENLGAALYFAQGKTAEALAQWREVLRLDPNHVPVLTQTAWVLATAPELGLRNGAEAVQLAERSVKLSGGGDPAILDALAAAYAEAGRFPAAIETAGRALSLARQMNNHELAQAIDSRIALYRSRTPYRNGPQPSPAPARR
jgi:tetratricopeptide (TPR) repeat protein